MKQKWIDAFMDTAERFAKLSSAERLKVGAVIVKDNRIISIGYNGTPAGWTNDCEYHVSEYNDVTKSWYPTGETKTRDEVIHAEANAIAKLARDGESGKDAVMFCTHAPCVQCAKMIYGAGIKLFYFKNDYRDQSGIEFLGNCGINVKKSDNKFESADYFS
jgi:dCMP deaminase